MSLYFYLSFYCLEVSDKVVWLKKIFKVLITVLQTDTGELVEYTKANKIIVSKELGKFIP